jgi:GH15 family glucan-1,4-alpha-glucosidase
MHTTWIESPAQGRHGGPVRAGQWSFVVIGTHPVEVGQTVGLELVVNDQSLGYLPGFWLENKAGNSYWHVPIPPLGINSKIRFQAISKRNQDDKELRTHTLHAVVRPNPPRWLDHSHVVQAMPEGLIGNRRTTARIDTRSSTYDIYYPSAALHSNVRPAEGDAPQSRTNFRGIVAGVAETGQIDWFGEQVWDSRQSYEPGTAVLKTVLSHRDGQLRVLVTDLAIMAEPWLESEIGPLPPGMYLKRYELRNDADHDRTMVFGLYVHSEINGGIGEPVLSWLDGERALLASNAGHGHSNRKLARDSTVTFTIALDSKGETQCEPVGPTEAVLTRSLALPARGSAFVDVLIAGSFTGWQADQGSFEHTLKPALKWFRSADLGEVEDSTIKAWHHEMAGQLKVFAPGTNLEEINQRSSITTLLHCDSDFGSVASGFDRGLNAYCRPREAIFTAEGLSRCGQLSPARHVFEWLESVRDKNPVHRFWFQKYSMDGVPEWETPSIDQTALFPWALARHVRRTGEIGLYPALWRSVKQAAEVIMGRTDHPGMEWDEKLCLMRSAGMWDLRFGCHLFGNASVVAGLRASAEIANDMNEAPELVKTWRDRADRILNEGILQTFSPNGPGLVDERLGHLRPARQINRRVGHWVINHNADFEEPSHADPGALGLCIPLGLLPAEDPRLQSSLQALVADINDPRTSANNYRTLRHDIQVLTRLWMARYSLKLAHRTGDGAPLAQAIALLHEVIDRLGPLGLSIESISQTSSEKSQRMLPGVWSLHLQIMEFMTELGGLEYDAIAKRLTFLPIMPWTLPSLGARIHLPQGWFRYQISRESHQRYVLNMEWETTSQTTLEADLVIPELAHVQSWKSSNSKDAVIPLPNMIWRPKRHSITWTETLPTGRHRVVREWDGKLD